MTRTYTLEQVAKLIGVPTARARELAALAFGAPRDSFGFRDVASLKTARQLTESKRPKAKIARMLASLREAAPLSALSVERSGKELVVGAGEARWNAESGQLLLDYGRPMTRATRLRPRRARDAEALFEGAVALEESDPAAAAELYLEAVAADPRHADAHVNLGRLRHQAGRLAEARAHYEAALVAQPEDAVATFNLGVVLEDLGLVDDAIARYQDALRLDPDIADAYFNLARLYELRGERVAALRNLKDYRRLSSRG